MEIFASFARYIFRTFTSKATFIILCLYCAFIILTLNIAIFALKSVPGSATNGLAFPAFGQLFGNLQSYPITHTPIHINCSSENVDSGSIRFLQIFVGFPGEERQIRVWSLKMATFASFVHCLPNILAYPLHGHTTAFTWYDCRWPWRYFKVIWLFHIKFLKNSAWYSKRYHRKLGNHTLAFDWCHFWWPWSTFEGHFTPPRPISRKLHRIRPQKLKLLIRWYECRWPWRYFKVIKPFHIKFLVNGALYGKSYCTVLIGNHTLAFDWCHFWWPWSTFEGHSSQGCHFHVHFSNLWQAFASRGLPAIAELLVMIPLWNNLDNHIIGCNETSAPQFNHRMFPVSKAIEPIF